MVAPGKALRTASSPWALEEAQCDSESLSAARAERWIICFAPISFATSATYKATPTCTMGSASKKYAATFKGVSHTYTDGGWVGLLHTVVLSGLSAATKYYYSCDGVSEFSFTSPKKVGSMPVTVGIIADLGEACSNSPGCGNSTISALGKAAAAGDFDVLVHAGDIAYTSGAQAIWDEYMREIEPAAAAVPYQVCAGNHEHYYNFSGYINRFAMASEGVAGVPTASKDGAASTMAVNNLFHSVDVGGVHLLGFSTEKPHFEDPAQLAFLKRDLQKAAANRGTVPWIVAYTHHPLYCSTNDFYDCQEAGTKFLRPVIEPLLVEFGVDLFFAGHLHNYERTYPLLNGTVHGGYQNATATVHAVVGMAGCDEGLTNTWMTPSPAWSAVRTAKLGYGRFTAHDRRSLTFEYVSSVDGSVFDNFTLTKDR